METIIHRQPSGDCLPIYDFLCHIKIICNLRLHIAVELIDCGKKLRIVILDLRLHIAVFLIKIHLFCQHKNRIFYRLFHCLFI